IQLAAFNGNIKTVRSLLAAGADPALADARGITPLMDAAAFAHPKVVGLLIQAGVDVNAKDNTGNSALSLAKKGGHSRVAELLMAAGAVEEAAPEEGAEGEADMAEQGKADKKK
ncbi:ankyrin, partial [Candidatus Endoriftia persephone str. Guaymas]|nr:ankyrin [Candidatus Endoriftia persephone str. Guaymas]